MIAQESPQGSNDQAVTAPQQSTAQPSPTRVRVSQGIMKDLIIKKVNPKYPEDARKAHVEGRVTLQVTISKDGDVTQLHLVSGNPLLAPAAMDAVKQWKYKPYVLEGQPVEVESTATISFTLNG
ncbi:MAG: energy transducer TonB [Terriglobales bacterium]